MSPVTAVCEPPHVTIAAVSKVSDRFLNILALVIGTSLICTGKPLFFDWMCNKFHVAIDPAYRLIWEALMIPFVLGLKPYLARSLLCEMRIRSSLPRVAFFITFFLDGYGIFLSIILLFTDKTPFYDLFACTSGISIHPEYRAIFEVYVILAIIFLSTLIRLVFKKEEKKPKIDEGRMIDEETGDVKGEKTLVYIVMRYDNEREGKDPKNKKERNEGKKKDDKGKEKTCEYAEGKNSRDDEEKGMEKTDGDEK